MTNSEIYVDQLYNVIESVIIVFKNAYIAFKVCFIYVVVDKK